jgi:hypothetical protein
VINFYSLEKKRRVYDTYGKEGLSQQSRGRSRYYSGCPGDDFGMPGFASFTFRDPEEVFREFFGQRSPFEDVLGMLLPCLHNSEFLYTYTVIKPNNIFAHVSASCPLHFLAMTHTWMHACMHTYMRA